MTQIELNSAEQRLLNEIELDALVLFDYEHARKNGALVSELMGHLLARKAIPERRLRWFTNADCNIGGRGCSRLDRFERNGTCGQEIFRHPHFLKYLRYFIFGSELPESIKAAFSDRVVACGQVTSSDILPIAKFARDLARQYQLKPQEASEEFYKHALDLGLRPDTAIIVRNQVRTIR